MKKKISAISFRIPILVILFLLGLSIFPLSKILSEVMVQQAVNGLTTKGGYPEIKGKKPTFQVDIKTADSMTHVISYLPESLLPREKFHEDAAKKTIEYVEKIAKEKDTYTFNPYAQGGSVVTVTMTPVWKGYAENYVFLISGSDPIPQILDSTKSQFTLLSESLNEGRTFFWTQRLQNGSVSFLRFAEDKTWKNGLPTQDNEGINSIQQLNTGFIIEIWKRSVVFSSKDINADANSKQIIFDVKESLWNTFGQTMAATQEGTPIEYMQHRFNNHPLSLKRNRAYYPFDKKVEIIHKNAPKAVIIR